MAFEALKEISQEQKMRDMALAREMFARDMMAIRNEKERNILERGIEQGVERGITRGIQAFVTSFLKKGFSSESIIEELIPGFDLTEEQAKEYYDRFSFRQV